MLVPLYSKHFKKSYRRLRRSGIVFRSQLEHVLIILSDGHRLPPQYRDHSLKGEYRKFRECHVKPDLLLVYRIEENIIHLVDIGSHADFFE